MSAPRAAASNARRRVFVVRGSPQARAIVIAGAREGCKQGCKRRELLSSTRFGFATRIVGSNIEAARYSGVPTRRSLTLIYTLSGLMFGLAGTVMLARFNSVRVGHQRYEGLWAAADPVGKHMAQVRQRLAERFQERIGAVTVLDVRWAYLAKLSSCERLV